MADSPLILVTNDDGVLAPGLAVLVEALAPLGEVLVCAPEAERSGYSHAISFHTHLRAASHAPGWWYLSGTPVDCVYFALNHLCKRPPALVCSGINAGYNLGTDVFYSGTVGAAAEGYLRGVSAIAVSGERGEHGAAWAAPVVAELARRVLTLSKPGLFNLNVPPLADHGREDPKQRAGRPGEPDLADLARQRPWRVTRLGERRYKDGVQPRTDPMGRPYYWIGGPPAGGSRDLEHDTGAVEAGLVSLTPLEMDITAPDLGPTRALLAGLEVPESTS